MTVRDKVLPPIDKARAVIDRLGLRRFAVTIRRRIWSGASIGDGTPTNVDIVIVPTPKVRFMAPYAQQMSGILMAGGKVEDRYFKIDKITPAYDNGTSSGGYTPDQLWLRDGQDIENIEPIVVLVGDDGLAKECSQVTFEEDRAFGYTMVVQETERPSTHLVSVAITPNPATVAFGQRLQLLAKGTFEDGQVYPVTPLVVWRSDGPGVATVNSLGVATGVAAGVANISASIGTIAAPVSPVTVMG